MVALVVRCYVTVAVQADTLVTSRLQRSEWALLYLFSCTRRVRGPSGIARMNRQAWRARHKQQGDGRPQPNHTKRTTPPGRHVGSLSLASLIGRITLGLLGRPSDGAEEPLGRAKSPEKETEMFSISGSLGGPGAD